MYIDYLIGSIIAIIICLVITLLVVLENKKNGKLITYIIKTLPKENVEIMTNNKFCNYEENNNFLQGLCIIYEIIENPNDATIKLLFYDSIYNKYRIDALAINKNEYKQKKLKVGMLIKTIHNKRKEIYLKVTKIL